MAVTMPRIEVTFGQRAGSLIFRSERGYAILIIRDSTNKTFNFKRYDDLAAAQKDETLYTSENFAAISDILAFSPYRTYVCRVDEDGAIADALSLVRKKVKTGWVTVAGMTPEDAAALAGWVKDMEKKFKSYKAVVYKPSVAPDSMHVVNFGNETVTFADARGEQSGAAYLPSLVGILAVCNVTRGCTNYLCSNLADVQEAEDNDKALSEGKFILFHDEDGAIRIAQGMNSLTTTNGKTLTEDMQFIETVEAMDLMRDDITKTFRDTYLGNYRNNRDNQMLFIAALNYSYFRQLSMQNILDPDYENAASIDIEAQRAAWLATGREEAAGWDDAKVKSMPFKRTVFLTANVKILGSMTDLIFPINMA